MIKQHRKVNQLQTHPSDVHGSNATPSTDQATKKGKSAAEIPRRCTRSATLAQERGTKRVNTPGGGKSAIAKERRIARSGFGQYVSTETGNIYLRVSCPN